MMTTMMKVNGRLIDHRFHSSMYSMLMLRMRWMMLMMMMAVVTAVVVVVLMFEVGIQRTRTLSLNCHVPLSRNQNSVRSLS